MGSKESEPIFIPVETTAEHALELMIDEMNQIRMKYISELYKTYEPFFGQISKLQDEKIIKQVRRKLLEWIDAIPVYGFNSSGYDINVFRKFLPKIMSKFQKNHGSISKAEKEWIFSLNEKLNRTLTENYRICNYNVDGYDSETKTVYKFYGCFSHVCPRCYAKDAQNPLAKKLMSDLYDYTIKRKNLKVMGYSVISIWECQFESKTGIQINNIIKSNNRYKMISNGKFIFKDILAYLSQGTSLDEFLKSFDTEKTKAFFPHKVTQNMFKYFKENPSLMQHKGNAIEILRNSKIPHKDWFANDMTNQKIEITDYLKIQDNYRNLYELLKDYNNSDVQPAVEAIRKLSAMFSSLNLDIHKDAISIPGLSLKCLWSSKQPGIEFKLFKDKEELYEMYRNNLVGSN
jgi:G:T-mismatch repair DNA endonuclease (very short patch repair protein)